MRTVRIAEEHALKVFDMNEMLDARIDSLMRGLGDDRIRAREADVHDTLLQLGGGYSQIASISIFGTDGMLLANSRYYPAQLASIARREDFVGIRGGRIIEHVSKAMTGYAGISEPVFNTEIARRNADGSFAGLISVALRRSYFESFYRELLGDESRALTVALIRADGAVLASYPPQPNEATPPTFASALTTDTKAGVLRIGSSPETGSGEILAYRRVGTYPLYVSCAYSGAMIWKDWCRRVAVFTASIFTPSIALWLVLALSLRRLAAEEEAWSRWQAEASTRRSIETAYRQSRKMEALGNLVGSVAHEISTIC
jgi:hypothetical protein